MRIDVACTPTASGHRCEVDLVDGGSDTHHTVEVSGAELDRWGRGRSAGELVRDSFRFLLDREPKESILREFKLSVITRYFPEYETAITRGRP
ncbi:MAG TPA: hypothetical protein VHK65_12825 [Candidatus Dormibacteraeota bacterium]|nr:hypothetical protein [Candidatus Dormibacteraeota bacterium]